MGPTCHLPPFHCGAMENTGAMAAAHPWPPLAPPRSQAPPEGERPRPRPAAPPPPPFSPVAANPRTARRHGRALTARRRTPPSIPATRGRSSRGKRIAAPPSSSSPQQSDRGARDRRNHLRLLPRVRRPPSSIAAVADLPLHRRAPRRAQGELTALLDPSLLSLPLWFAGSVEADLEPPR